MNTKNTEFLTTALLMLLIASLAVSLWVVAVPMPFVYLLSLMLPSVYLFRMFIKANSDAELRFVVAFVAFACSKLPLLLLPIPMVLMILPVIMGLEIFGLIVLGVSLDAGVHASSRLFMSMLTSYALTVVVAIRITYVAEGLMVPVYYYLIAYWLLSLALYCVSFLGKNEPSIKLELPAEKGG